MAWDMDGKSNSINKKRIEILKEKALKMIDRLAALDFNIYVSIVPFSNNANNPYDFKNLHVKNELDEVKDIINNLKADGSTNTGDGIRRAYYQLKNKASSLISSGQIDDYSDITQHMMILVDGESNTETRKITGTFWFFVTSEHITDENGNTNNSVVVGNKRTVDVGDNNNNYVNFIGNNLVKPYKYNHEGEQKQAINSFVIGFSNLSKDHNSLESIGNSVLGKQFEHSSGTMKPYILATNADELDFAFEQFESEVENSLWIITRPQLWP